MTEPDSETSGGATASEAPPKTALPPPNPPPRRSSVPPAPLPPLNSAAIPASPKRSRTGLVALGVGAALLVVAGGVGSKLYFARPSPLPVPLAKLPEELTTIEAFDLSNRGAGLEMRSEDMPPEALWSYESAQLCGGRDLFADLLDAEKATGGADGIAEYLGMKDEAKTTLSCGKTIAQTLSKKARFYRLHLNVHHTSHFIDVARYDAADLPETSKLLKSAKAPDHLEAVRCSHLGEALAVAPIAEPDEPSLEADGGEPKKKTKDPDADCRWVVAKIEHEPLWIAGDMPTLKAFGEGYSPDGKNKIEEAELFQSVLDGLSGAVIAAGHGDDRTGSVGLEVVRDEEMLAKTLRILRDMRVWGFSATFDGPFERHHFEWHATKESDAKDAVEAVERYTKELKREVKDEDDAAREAEARASDAKGASDPDPIEARVKFRAAHRKLRWRALEDAKIDRSGVIVTLDTSEKPEASDNQAWKEYADVQKARAKNAAAIVDALIAASAPSDDDEKALSPKLYAALHPPDSMSVEGFGDLKIPGGGKCYAVDQGIASCAFPKWDEPVTLEKLKTQIAKAGFTITRGASDATLLATRGTIAVVVDIYGTPEKGSHVTLTISPAKTAP